MRIIFTVTNDLTYDQRMHRICGTLAAYGHDVILLGRELPASIPLEINTFQQKRLFCLSRKGFVFYAEYNLRLFWFLLFARFDALCSIDLDTLPAGCLASLIRKKKRVFDAHEYFTEVPEVVDRPFVRFVWSQVARICLPFYHHAYTVGPALAQLFKQKYGLTFEVVRNMPLVNRSVTPNSFEPKPSIKTILYQGALNEGRGIEVMLEAMQYLEGLQLVLAGEGDLSAYLRQRAAELKLGDRVVFLGFVKPDELQLVTAQAWLGLNLLENRGLSYYYSLANKFFDCVQAGVPVITMDFPEYQALNTQFEVAILLKNLSAEMVVQAIQDLLNDPLLYEKLHHNCLIAGKTWNWEKEQQVLLQYWQKVESAETP